MAFPVATIVLTVPPGGAKLSALQAAVAAVPLQQPMLTFLGANVLADVTVPGPPVTRTIRLLLVAPVTASATAHVSGSEAGSPIERVTVNSGGQGYVTAPVPVVLEPGPTISSAFFEAPTQGRGAHLQAYLSVRGPTAFKVSGGTGYSAQTTVGFIGGFPLGSGARSTPPVLTGAQPPAGVSGSGGQTTRVRDAQAGPMNLGSVGMIARGLRYSLGTTVEFLGLQAPGGHAAQGVPIFGAKGSIVGVLITDPGAGYIVAPEVVFLDPLNLGTGARAGASMVRGTPATGHVTLGGGGTISTLVIDTPGDGYVLPPSLVIFDPTGAGSGANFLLNMQVGRIDVLNGGQGYIAPAVQVLSVYESYFAKAIQTGVFSDTLLPFVNFMAAAIAKAVATPVSVSLPS